MEKTDECETELALYDQYVTLFTSLTTGGVTSYFKQQGKLNRIKENVMDSKHWISVYITKCESISFIIVIIYRLLSYRIAEFCEDLQQFLEDLCEKSNDIILAVEIGMYIE